MLYVYLARWHANAPQTRVCLATSEYLIVYKEQETLELITFNNISTYTLAAAIVNHGACVYTSFMLFREVIHSKDLITHEMFFISYLDCSFLFMWSFFFAGHVQVYIIFAATNWFPSNPVPTYIWVCVSYSSICRFDMVLFQ